MPMLVLFGEKEEISIIIAEPSTTVREKKVYDGRKRMREKNALLSNLSQDKWLASVELEQPTAP